VTRPAQLPFPKPRVPVPGRIVIEPHTFTGGGCTPDPDAVIPEWLRLPTDDPDWQPDGA